MKIRDGAGSGRESKVNAKNRLDVTAASLNQSALTAVSDGQTFIWTSSFSAATGNEVIYIKNDSKDKLLFIEDVVVSSVNAGLLEIYEVTGTAAGTPITGKNTNLTSSNVAVATAFGDAAVTGLTLGDRIDLARTSANGRVDIKLADILIMGFNNAIAAQYTGSTGIVDVAITGFYEIEADL